MRVFSRSWFVASFFRWTALSVLSSLCCIPGSLRAQGTQGTQGASSGGNSIAGSPGLGSNTEAFGANSSAPTAWDRTFADAFQMGMRNRSMGSMGGGFNGHPGNLESLFLMGGKMSQDFDKSLGAGDSGALGTALGILPKLNQLKRNGVKLPLNSSLGKFQLSYRDQLGPGGNALGGGIGRGAAGATFNSTGLKDDMLRFSATAMYGGSGGGIGSSFLGSGVGSGALGAGAPAGSSGMFSLGGMNGAGIGSGPGSFSAGSMHGMMGGAEAPGGMRGGGEGSHGRGAETGPSLSLKLTFK